MVAVEPNAENKLFVGGCPAGSGEDDLRALFEKHGTVEEVFVMRGGSRSGMACAFIRFTTQQMAQAAIDNVHGRITMPSAAEPLVVRWADAPGSRKRDGREGRRGKGGGGGPGGGLNGGGPSGRGGLGGGMDPNWAAQMGPMGPMGYGPGFGPPGGMMMVGQPMGPMGMQQNGMGPPPMGPPFYGGQPPPNSLAMQHQMFSNQQQMGIVYVPDQQMMQGQPPPQFWQGPPSPHSPHAMPYPMAGPPHGGMQMRLPTSVAEVQAHAAAAQQQQQQQQQFQQQQFGAPQGQAGVMG